MNVQITRLTGQPIEYNQVNNHHRRFDLIPSLPLFAPEQLNRLVFSNKSPLNRRPIEVTWRPPYDFLHYNDLYYGLYEYLRAPPAPEFKDEATNYLADLRRNSLMFDLIPEIRRLQNDRIIWVVEWLKAVPNNTEDCSDADTVEHE